jgi:GTP cyclohydrolase I
MSELDAVKTILTGLDVDPMTDELAETPARYLRALRKMTGGYRLDPAEILSKTFALEGSDLVVCQGIHFAAVCQHHLLPFSGTARVAYLPAGRVVGLSKVARLVDCFARRLTLQERLTGEIADALFTHLRPVAVEVEVTAWHGCVCCRGVRQPGMEVVTVTRKGNWRTGEGSRS